MPCVAVNLWPGTLIIGISGSRSPCITRGRLCHKVRIYKEYHSACPFVGIGTLPTPLSPARVPLPPEPGEGDHSPASEGLGESQFRRLEKKLSTLPTLWSLYTEDTSSTLAPLLRLFSFRQLTHTESCNSSYCL
jgi:hypothetical protein